jgi:hypothetical protein
MVEQSQERQLAMPVLCSAALLFRRWLSTSNRSRAAWAPRRHASRLRKPATAKVVASLRVHLTGRSGGTWRLRVVIRQLVWEEVKVCEI